MFLFSFLLVSVPTYFVLGSQPLPSSVRQAVLTHEGEVCPNLTFLGKQGVLRTKRGLSLAYLGGMAYQEGLDSADLAEDECSHVYTKADVSSLVSKASDGGFGGVDLLITFEWPRDISKKANPTDLKVAPLGSAAVAEVARELRPRYHFAAKEETYYERVPYKNLGMCLFTFCPQSCLSCLSSLYRCLIAKVPGKPIHVTRFYGMAPVGNTEKKKWIYAVSVAPIGQIDVAQLNQVPPEATENPFSDVSGGGAGGKQDKRGREAEEAPASFFFAQQPQHQPKRPRNEGPRGGGGGEAAAPAGSGIKRFQPANQGCWFCLANPQVEKHLVVSIGNEVYLALAKGGLTPDHALIIPMEHHPASTSLPESALEEVTRFKQSLRKAFKGSQKDVVFFEVNVKSQHMILQVIPVPESATPKLRDSFMEISQDNGVVLQDQEEVQLTPTDSFFKVDLPGENRGLVHVVRGRFNLQLGRQVMAKVLGTPEKADWKLCVVDAEKEKEYAARFRNFFKPYDFTLE